MISLTQESLQSSKEWSDKEVKILIDHYQGNLVLWDHRSKEYRDRDLRKLALQKLKAIKKLKEIFLFCFFLTTTVTSHTPHHKGNLRPFSSLH